ncbi:MAG: HD domain-containing protein [Deltaproteobacteria bacterium]|nr:HD domain-containing protein [Deltaproteobacteria bacterium]MCL5880359.1 HD domain-containing protein [Deltaproteobacteria bacterium]
MLNIDILENLRRLNKVAQARDEATGKHTQRIAAYCKLLTKALHLSNDFANDMFFAAPMHDIGKVGIPDNILLKPGKLTPDEFETIKFHCEIGYKILNNSGNPGAKNDIFSLAAEIALTHHEKWDGSGYPNGLRGNNIPLSGRITIIADVFDALTNGRVYKPAYSTCESVRIMRDEMSSGKAFDPDIFTIFIKNIDGFDFIKEKQRK